MKKGGAHFSRKIGTKYRQMITKENRIKIHR